jgi:pyruvate/2-oxoglutarate dehydrogenase complex dihydrolipoamide acyltransferase (E2) component
MTTVAVIPETALLDSQDRLLVSPAYGRVTVPVPVSFTSEGEVARAGDILAIVDADGTRVEVCAPCDAWVMGYLIREGQRVEPGSAIAHLRAL